MKPVFKFPLLGILLLLPFSVAYAQAPSVSPISNISINAGIVATVNVVAVDLNNDAITLTAELPAFGTLNPPTTGTGSVNTTLTLAPTAVDVGSFTGRVIATAAGVADTTTFLITVSASGSNQAPVVTAPAVQTTSEGVNLNFTVSVVDADADAIVALTTSVLPAGATFTPNGTNTSGTFSWTPTSTQAGDYDVVFTATSGVLTGAATTHIQVADVPLGTLSIAEINNVTLAEGTSITVNVNVTGPTSGTIALTPSLPGFAVLNAPTSSTGTGTLATTITISPAVGSAGTYSASVTATAGLETDTEGFTITVTPVGGGGGLQATASLVGSFNTHKKFICFRVKPVNGSFDMRNVILTGVTLSFGGTSINAMSSKTHLTWECEDDDDFGDDCGECDDEDGEHDADCDTLNCEAQLRACFSMSDIDGLFDVSTLPGEFVNATVNGTLSTGGTFSATVDAKFAGQNGNHKGLGSKIRPNPVNPKTELTFRLSQPGRVRVLVYDLQGRLVKTLLDENRPVGDQTVSWNGSNSRSATVSSGVYFVKIKAPEGQEVQRVTVLK